MNNDYPFIYQFMGAYFTQDYDIITNSDTIEGVIDYYIAETLDDYLRQLVKEMERFELEHQSDLDKQFERNFTPEITINPVHDFFELVKSKIQKHLEQSK